MKLLFSRFSALLALSLAVLTLAVSYPPSNALAQENPAADSADDKPADDKPAEEKPADQAEQPSPVELTGIFQATRTHAVQILPKEWATLTVKEVVEHGAEVQAGDVLISLDTEELEKTVSDAETEIQLSELALEDARVKLDLAQRSQELALEAAAKADRVATEDLREFLTTGRQRQVRSIDRGVESTRDRLEYQEEELHQLEKMYAADDLTEETEEIILKRTRDAVEAARYGLEVAEESRRNQVELEIPRNEEVLESAVAKAALALEEARRTAPQSVQRQQIQFEQEELALEKKRTRLADLRKDMQQLKITSPVAGIVYYGSERRGKWSDPAATEAMLQPDSAVKPKTTLLTVVQVAPLVVRVTVPEESLRHVKPGTKAMVTPVAYPDTELTSYVQSVSVVPVGEGQFDATLEVHDLPNDPKIMPGMKAKVRIPIAGALAP
jgi:multidrug resistance efflux pump